MEQTFVGPENETVLYVAEVLPSDAPQVGERAVFFLGRWKDEDVAKTARRRIDSALEGAPVWQP